jgi:GNAT superfamily N-acetyltransferase
MDVTFEEVHYHRDMPAADIAALNAFENVIAAEEHPDDPPRPLELTDGEARNIPDFVAFREFWGRDPDGSLAAMGYGHWRKDVDDNRHLLNCTIQVRPDRRRRGLGRTLLGHIADIADGEGRTVLMFGTNERVPAGEAFARRLEAKPAFKAHTNRLVLSRVDRALVDRWIAEGPERGKGYSLFTIDGAMPDDLIDRFAELSDVMNTAPRDDLDMEDSHITPEQIRQFEASLAAQGIEKWTLFARHDATGELVGYTEVWWSPRRAWVVSQGDTGVRPEHRGHALGKWLKATMLRRILEQRPEAKDVRTGNADSNDAMLGINHALGFEPYLGVIWWNLGVDRVRAYLGSST